LPLKVAEPPHAHSIRATTPPPTLPYLGPTSANLNQPRLQYPPSPYGTCPPYNMPSYCGMQYGTSPVGGVNCSALQPIADYINCAKMQASSQMQQQWSFGCPPGTWQNSCIQMALQPQQAPPMYGLNNPMMNGWPMMGMPGMGGSPFGRHGRRYDDDY